MRKVEYKVFDRSASWGPLDEECFLNNIAACGGLLVASDTRRQRRRFYFVFADLEDTDPGDYSLKPSKWWGCGG